MVLAFVLVDCRHEPQSIDLEFMQWMGESGIPFNIIFTKADKLKPKPLEEKVREYSKKMLETWEEMPRFFITSANDATGRDEVLAYIDQLNSAIQHPEF
jgi:GTP-binding protein